MTQTGRLNTAAASRQKTGLFMPQADSIMLAAMGTWIQDGTRKKRMPGFILIKMPEENLKKAGLMMVVRGII